MKTIIVGKLVCDDSILKASRTLGAREVKDVISAALTFTPFTVEKVNLVFARVSEKYYLACKKLGYDWGFFPRKQTACIVQSAAKRKSVQRFGF